MTSPSISCGSYSPLSYLDSCMVMACYSMNDAQSFTNISHRWIPEIKHLLPKAPIILLGLKCDLKLNDVKDEHDEPDVVSSPTPISHRPNLKDFPQDLTHLDDEHFQLPVKRVSSEQGKVLAWKLGIDDYVELSAKDRTGIESLRASIHAQLSKLDKHFKWRKVSKMIAL
ncbi:rho-related GTP-binding protein RhoA-B-like isoform X2 [Tigriopus californicus]|uniref:rho-related GTP-binding protein RhoA-B-like isoform X2 n=1 Tax=Tigriopus californicus TaxID=6832 RepID=UPI0027DA3DC7|nr:rho-related GTP-binding protein RhoA-B-like isoform X2 [Tigriopus californicus]